MIRSNVALLGSVVIQMGTALAATASIAPDAGAAAAAAPAAAAATTAYIPSLSQELSTVCLSSLHV